jgi:uncharacterized protein YycO
LDTQDDIIIEVGMNNKGSVLILMVIVIALVIVMGLSVLNTAAKQYEIKKFNIDSKESFYVSETGINEAYVRTCDLMDESIEAALQVADDYLAINPSDLAPYKNGYVLVTKATHSLGWRHGHAGIVTDADNKETLEAVLLGQDSMLQDINKWRNFPSFMMLKLKDASQEDLDEIARFAKNNLLNVPYGLSVGFFSKKNPEPDSIKTTQCAHIVWYPFMQFGYDIDSDGTWLVTPKDIANSDLFEIVQIYGVNPDEIWK